MIENTTTAALIAEIAREAEDNEGLTKVTAKRDGSIAVRYGNGFNNLFLPKYAGGNWSAKAVAAALRLLINK